METVERDFNHLQDVEVIGDGILAMVEAFSDDSFCKTLLERHGLTDVEKGVFYPMAAWASVLHDIQTNMPKLTQKVGEHIVQEAVFPPEISFEQLLFASDEAYQMNHRGFDVGQIGGYSCEKKSDTEYLFTVSSPYPCRFNQGIVKGYARRFNLIVSIEHADEGCMENGDEHCCYRIVIKGKIPSA